MELVRNYLIAFVVFFVIDILWLGFVAKDFYREQLGFIMATKTNWPAAIVFYLIFIGGLMFFAINPALAKDSIKYESVMRALDNANPNLSDSNTTVDDPNGNYPDI